MQDHRKAWVTCYLLSCIALVVHGLFLIDRYVGGIGLFEKDNVFNHQLLHMHFSAQWPLIQFFLVIIGTYFFFAWMIYYFVLLLRRWGVEKTGSIILSIRCWMITYLAVLILNSYLFPNSQFAFSFFSVFSEWPNLTRAAFYLSLLIMTSVWLGFLITATHKLMRHRILFFIVLFIIAAFFGYRLLIFHYDDNSNPARSDYENKKPNIIIIYYCSFKANFLSSYPNFKAFADHSIWFKNATSPVARSGPGLFAMLSGLYPATSHFFDNLNWKDRRIPYQNSIAYHLQQDGYQTIFIANSSTFRRIDKKLTWGFQDIITPPTHVYTLMLSKIDDVPLTNLLFELSLEKILFPSSYNNADDVAHYLPNNFLDEIDHVLTHRLERKPLFLMINDEIMHFPYLMARMPQLPEANKYNAIMGVADQQFKQYLQLLNEHHLLKNAIVILAADHGETEKTDPHVAPTVAKIRKQSAAHHALLRSKLIGGEIVIGHGGNAMDKEQFHVPVIFHFYGNNQNIPSPQKINTLISTVDIKPTLLQLLHLSNGDTDGESLIPLMSGKKTEHKVVYATTSLGIALPGNPAELKTLARILKTFTDVGADGTPGYQLNFISQVKRRISVGAYWKNFRMIYWPAAEDQMTHQFTPALFCIMNGDNFTLYLMTETEMQPFLKNPDPAKLKALGMTAADVNYLYTHVMNYRKKILASANEPAPERVL
ncbi:MAG: hypothetical protein ACD_42C00396G0012 [uncultured bacterium]|nr:MAG: hypothetical protein ACD_42C00396G0012 [uncultured bacterium]OGT33358.1 MAG: hypothetical protein A3C44_04000 [Gammaproteobacteria bacterium RIFCSPHIGHO2_02_FULL_39_13]OGT50300.1 MAG: hypothetical protein A3E53_00925 [Gammaproteobacteria bacterium RIFCSPHIGHO2_12_FULL_39_24]